MRTMGSVWCQADPHSTKFLSASRALQAAIAMHIVEGYLYRRGRHLKSWRRRFFIFEDGMLLYKKNDDTTSRVLDEDRVFDILYWSGRPHGLCLKLRGDRLIYLTARSEEDATRWHDTIESYLTEQRCIEDLRRALCRGRLPSIRESVSELARPE
ncbi:hypothetical protein AM587_10009272 [Phytophthora nicotianae]|uniref:PH domain-containing protein n=5 Tax=Phytophthora nicotianae TaxID=4792 RepID=V9FR16_PHYNI|nr:hypothetical protein F443_03211 [Phytophthora nicotianae P1569]ETO82610.1 hypothetical protein F444_03280 [Phytophthora nicotianae P1976]KUF87394.1 hypothetical protein AM587_10009272 [Phytophthora nicotianae]